MTYRMSLGTTTDLKKSTSAIMPCISVKPAKENLSQRGGTSRTLTSLGNFNTATRQMGQGFNYDDSVTDKVFHRIEHHRHLHDIDNLTRGRMQLEDGLHNETHFGPW